ncbi:DUF2252 family protein [Salinibius halmophilus]|uniref:DUF2252 family protein n=1 Tax=Salinibius halmophilus TaxID=1853216 RepID=UPI000E66644F|nr:DUF2252 family protein [Salinibius halmophilus]
MRATILDEVLTRNDGHSPNSEEPIGKHYKMASNPFRFFRGSAPLFYYDLASQIVLPKPFFDVVPHTAIMGDCHVANFGFFTEEGSHGNQVIFAPNDFDDACFGPAVWDLLRFATSLLLSGDYARGLLEGRYDNVDGVKLDGKVASDQAEDIAAATAFIEQYANALALIIGDDRRRDETVYGFDKPHVLRKPEKKALARAPGGKDFARKSTLAKLTEHAPTGHLQFADLPDKFVHLESEERRAIEAAFRPYVDDEIIDIVSRVGAGTGSLELSRYYLLVGPKHLRTQEDIFLCHVVEVKQQRPAAPLAYFNQINPRNQLNPAHLTASCQGLMQHKPDLILDEVYWQNQHWLIRSRHHARVGIDPDNIALRKKNPGEAMVQYARTTANALALAHSRGDRRSLNFEVEIVRALTHNDDAIIEAAQQYYQQVLFDHNWLASTVHKND